MQSVHDVGSLLPDGLPPEGDLPWEESPNRCLSATSEWERMNLYFFHVYNHCGETYKRLLLYTCHLLSNDGNLTVSLNAD